MREIPFSIYFNDRESEILADGSWQQELATELRTDFWVYADVGRASAGTLFAEFIVRKAPHDGTTITDRYVHAGNIQVREQFQRRGIGSQLIEEMEQHARRFGASRIEGIVSSIDLNETPTLLGFYQRRGYELTPVEAGFTMVKWL